MLRAFLLSATLLANPAWADGLSAPIAVPAIGQSSTAAHFPPQASAAYTGPGNIQAFQDYWGLRCYNNAYASNVADVWDTATGTTTETLLTCSAGGTINQTIHTLAVTCAVSCSVKTLYDQVGGSNMAWASVSAGPTLTISCANSNPCMKFNGSQQLETSVGITLGFTATVYGVGERTSNTGAFNSLAVGDTTSTYQIGWANASGSVFSYNGGSPITITGATESVFHVFVATFTGSTSDSFSIDGGTASTGINTGAGNLSGNQYILGLSSGSVLDGGITEAGLISGALSGGTVTSLCHNARIYWGSAGSC